MAVLATQRIDNDGLAPSYSSAAGGGDKVACGQGAFIHVKNGDSTATDVTLVTPEVVDGTLAVQDRTVTVPGSGGERFIAVPDLYRGADSMASLTYSKVTSLTLASLRAPVA